MFASDGVNPVGGVPAVGNGLPAYNAPFVQPRSAGAGQGVERSRLPLVERSMYVDGNAPLLTQVPVSAGPSQAAHSEAPSLTTMFGKLFQVLLNKLRAPEPTRGDNIPTSFESVQLLSGMPTLGMPGREESPDPERRGLMFEPVEESGVAFAQWGNRDLTSARNVGEEEILNQGDDPPPSDLAVQVQDIPTNEQDYLRAYRASFPSASVRQAPAMARSVVLAQPDGATGAFVGELAIPSGAVTARIAWTGQPTNDLWVSLSSSAVVPDGTVQPTVGGIPQAAVQNDGPILNPDQTTDFLVKGKRAMAFSCDAACTVNVAFYMQA